MEATEITETIARVAERKINYGWYIVFILSCFGVAILFIKLPSWKP